MGQEIVGRERGGATGGRELGKGTGEMWFGDRDLRRGNWGQGTWDRELGAGNWDRELGTGNLGQGCKTKNIFSSSVLGGVRRGAQEGGVQRRAEGFRYRSGSNIGWFWREAVGSPKKIEHPLGSEIFKPKVYSWEPSWYSGGVFKRKHFVAGAGNGARSADFVARGLGGRAAPPMQQE